MPPKERCQYCGKLFYERKLKIHLKYICGPHAAKTAKQSKQQKKSSVAKKTFETEDGKKPDSEENDYITKDSAIDGPRPSAGKSILHFVTWERIILDEVSVIVLLSHACIFFLLFLPFTSTLPFFSPSLLLKTPINLHDRGFANKFLF